MTYTEYVAENKKVWRYWFLSFGEKPENAHRIETFGPDINPDFGREVVGRHLERFHKDGAHVMAVQDEDGNITRYTLQIAMVPAVYACREIRK